MAKNPRKPAERIKDFKSISAYTASTAKEGDIDAPVFDGSLIRRRVHNGQPYLSVVDMVVALADTTNANRYWTDLKRKLHDEEGFPEVYEKIVTLALPTRGGPQETDCADIKTLLRIVQSIPSPKADPFKQWLATVGYERIQETAQPSQPSSAQLRALESRVAMSAGLRTGSNLSSAQTKRRISGRSAA